MDNAIPLWAETIVRNTNIAQTTSASELLVEEYERTMRIVNEVASMQGVTFPTEQEWNGHRLACQMIRERLERGRG